MKKHPIVFIFFIIIVIDCERFEVFFDYEKQYQWPNLCATGQRQSPIDIQFYQAHICPKDIQYSVTKSENGSQIIVHHIQNTKDLQNPFQQQTFIKLVENTTQVKFKSLQFHWHTPSEHTINGKHFDLQLHIVHKSMGTDGKVAVTGLLFNVVGDQTATIFDELNLAEADKETFEFPFELDQRFVVHYKGSLTTPPCSEVVDWFVYLEPYEINRFQLQKIIAAKNNGKPNSRNVHNLNKRQLYFLSPKCTNI